MSRYRIAHLVLMGVSGCGKSSVGARLAARTGLPYLDGDDLHPTENIERMRRGIPWAMRIAGPGWNAAGRPWQPRRMA
ncbi:shikimate kinase [Paracoccus kondratievae]